VNLKGISVVVVVAAMILLVVLLPIKPQDVSPVIQDEAIVDEDVTLDVTPSDSDIDTADSPDITESTVVEEQTSPNHSVINATDAPNFGG